MFFGFKNFKFFVGFKVFGVIQGLYVIKCVVKEVFMFFVFKGWFFNQVFGLFVIVFISYGVFVFCVGVKVGDYVFVYVVVGGVGFVVV